MSRRFLRRLCRRRSVILGYHGVADDDPRRDLSRLQVTPDRFDHHLQVLGDAGFRFVSLHAFAERLGAEPDPPPGYAVITFDDGLRNNLTVAEPILRAHGVSTATVFVASGLIGGWSPWIGRGGDGAMLSSDEVRELARRGWEIGGHTVSHADLSALDYDGCRREIANGCRAIEAITHQPVTTFAYPFGRYGPDAVRAVGDCGLLAAVTTGSGRWERHELTRAMYSRGDPDPLVALKLVDLYEPLLALPALRALRTGSRRARAMLRRGG